jgi:DNA-binding FadR family transcriptional regulator
MTPLQPLAKPPSLHHSVQLALKEYITAADLKPGDPLPAESELARRLGVSRNSVREAVKALETVGVLETRRGSGVFVGSFSFDPLLEALPYGLMVDTHDLTDLLDVRGALEGAMVPRAIATQTPEQLAKLREVLAAMRACAEAGEPIDGPDRAFHRTLFEPIGNRVLLRLIDIFWESFHRAAVHVDLGNDQPLATWQDHARIVDAYERRDADAMRRTLDQHYDGIRTLLKGGDAPSTRRVEAD